MNPKDGRYARQRLLPGFGIAGQERLAASTVVILGCGALGTVVAESLVRAGIGHLVLVDRDFVELSNLQRQVLFDEQDVVDVMPKAEAAKRKLGRINRTVTVTAITDDLNHRNIVEYAAEADLLVDGLDNFETRYLANDFAVSRAIPYIYGAAVGTTGMTMSVLPAMVGDTSLSESSATPARAGPCLRCLFPEPPPAGTGPTCEAAGVLGPLTGLVANLEATAALKLLTGNADKVSRSLQTIDLWANSFQTISVPRAPDCPCCAKRSFDYLTGKRGAGAAVLCGRNAVQLRPQDATQPPRLVDIAERLAPLAKVLANEFVVRVNVTENGASYDLTLFRDGRAIVHGTDSALIARRLYAKYIGD